MLNVAIKAARAAGAIINRAALDVEAVRISQKQVNDFVTEVDHAAEQAIIETLLTAYPGHGILAEETGNTHGAKHSDYVWIIDPLDGTTNFIHDNAPFCISIALRNREEVLLGVVYEVCRNECFWSYKGIPAYLDEEEIHVSAINKLNKIVPLKNKIAFVKVIILLKTAIKSKIKYITKG